MTEPLNPRSRPNSHRSGGSRTRTRSSPPTGAADVALVVVIAACFVPVGLLVIAVHGGGLVTVVIAFIAEVLITAALIVLIGRAVDKPSRGHR
jgi:hypothetical protein